MVAEGLLRAKSLEGASFGRRSFFAKFSIGIKMFGKMNAAVAAVIKVLLPLAMLSACAVKNPAAYNAASNNPELLRLDKKPDGYPKTRVEQREGGYCVRVTEDWVEGDYLGRPMWTKKTTDKGVDCQTSS